MLKQLLYIRDAGAAVRSGSVDSASLTARLAFSPGGTTDDYRSRYTHTHTRTRSASLLLFLLLVWASVISIFLVRPGHCIRKVTSLLDNKTLGRSSHSSFSFGPHLPTFLPPFFLPPFTFHFILFYLFVDDRTAGSGRPRQAERCQTQLSRQSGQPPCLVGK